MRSQDSKTNNESDRLQQLRQFLIEDPHDPFNHYALALETAKVNAAEAVELLQQLISSHPHYIPSYYQAAILLEQLGRLSEVPDLLQQGIHEAAAQSDLKAIQEMRNLLSSMEE